MAPAKALAVAEVEAVAVVRDLDDVVGKHPMRWLCLSATLAEFHRFASPTGSGEHGFAPCSVFGCEIDRIGSLGQSLDDAAIQSLHQWCDASQTCGAR